MIRRIRDLLYDQGFTISGARNKLQELVQRGWKISHTDSVYAIAHHDESTSTELSAPATQRFVEAGSRRSPRIAGDSRAFGQRALKERPRAAIIRSLSACSAAW